MLPADILSYGARTLERHVKAARELAALVHSHGGVMHSAGFVAELIDREATRAGATLDVLSGLCPEITPELRDAHTATAHTLRKIREGVLATLVPPTHSA